METTTKYIYSKCVKLLVILLASSSDKIRHVSKNRSLRCTLAIDLPFRNQRFPKCDFRMLRFISTANMLQYKLIVVWSLFCHSCSWLKFPALISIWSSWRDYSWNSSAIFLNVVIMLQRSNITKLQYLKLHAAPKSNIQRSFFLKMHFCCISNSIKIKFPTYKAALFSTQLISLIYNTSKVIRY